MECRTWELEHEPRRRKRNSRLATFKKRKHSLIKKGHELSTLCDVEVCIILYGPKHKGQPVKPETWTSKEGNLISVITKYKKNMRAGVGHGQQRTLALLESDEKKAMQVDDAATRARKKNCARKFNTWDQRMDSLSENQLQIILVTMDNKLKVVDRKLSMIKGDQNLTDKATSRGLDYDSYSNDAMSILNLQSGYQVSQKLPSDSSDMQIQ